MDASAHLVALDPPPPPIDLTQSALFFSLRKITKEHTGRKLRTIGQILAFDPRNSLLLLSAPSSSASPNPISTLLINLATALLGGSPAASDLSSVSDGVYSRDSRPPPTIRNNSGGQRTGLVNRERLRLERGEWIVVVGWLEGEGRRLLHQVETGSSYAAPIGVVLEAIHIAMTQPPPDHALHRGDIDPRRGQHSMSMVDRVIRRMSHTSSSQENGEDAAEDETPRPKRSRPHR